MKTILTLIAAVLISGHIYAQDFSKYENQPGISTVVINKNMFKLMSRLDLDSQDKEIQQYVDLINNMENIKIFKTDKKDMRSELASDANAYAKNNNLEELMRVQEDGKKVSFMFKPGKTDDEIQQLFMLVDGMGDDGETIVIIINGLLDLRQISKLAKDLNVPGASSLKNEK
jgi:hypothetical protein